MTPPEAIALAHRTGMFPSAIDNSWLVFEEDIIAFANLVEARVREEAAGKADTREAYCAETMKLPGLRLEDVMVWEQRQNEARSIARAIRNP